MSTKQEFWKGSQLRISDSVKSGRITLGQICEMCDALTCIYVCCNNAFGDGGMPERFKARAEVFRKTIGLSVAKARLILKAWHKWTCWRDGGNEYPTTMQVTSFLLDESLNA